MAASRIPYLNNRDLLTNVHLSKLSFCDWIAPGRTNLALTDYDTIVRNELKVTSGLLAEARRTRAERITRQKTELAKTAGIKARVVPRPDTVTEPLVIRVLTSEHVPQGTRPNFPPFKHYAVQDGQPQEVLRSHWRGGHNSGAYAEEGKINDDLAVAVMMMVRRYATRGNWRGYSYVDEMQSSGIVQLLQGALKFNEFFGFNVFGYWTTVLTNSFRRYLAEERKLRGIRDEYMMAAGMAPSWSRQEDNTTEQQDRAPSPVRHIEVGSA